jgi:hypothetical protein
VVERKRWLELERDYGRAHAGVHTASMFVHYAGELLRKIRDDREFVERARRERQEREEGTED